MRHRGLRPVRGIDQLAGHRDAGETDDGDPVADLEHAGIAQRQGRHVGGLHAQEREVAAGHRGSRARRTVLGDPRAEPDAVLQDDPDPWVELHQVGGRGGEGLANEALLDLRPRARRQTTPREDIGQAVGAKGLLDQVSRQPAARRLVGDEHDVAVGDQPAPRAQEESGAALAIGRRRDGLVDTGAAQLDLAGDLGDDDRRRRLGAQQHFLQRALLRAGSGRQQRKHGGER